MSVSLVVMVNVAVVLGMPLVREIITVVILIDDLMVVMDVVVVVGELYSITGFCSYCLWWCRLRWW